MHACAGGQTSLVRQLLAADPVSLVDANKRGTGRGRGLTPLMLACLHGHTSVVRELLFLHVKRKTSVHPWCSPAPV